MELCRTYLFCVECRLKTKLCFLEQVSNSDATSQLFINFPLMIANALEIDGMLFDRSCVCVYVCVTALIQAI